MCRESCYVSTVWRGWLMFSVIKVTVDIIPVYNYIENIIAGQSIVRWQRRPPKMSNQFYITLPSNASIATYPTNSKRSLRLCCRRGWIWTANGKCMGMTKFSYPVSWHNIDNRQWFKMKAYSLRESDQYLIDAGVPRKYVPDAWRSLFHCKRIIRCHDNRLDALLVEI
jgi:hypothetical protein